MARIRPLGPADRQQIVTLGAAVERHDGIPAFSEFKAVDMARRSGMTLGESDDGMLAAAAHVAWHHGDEVAPGHWAIEVAVHPDRREPAQWSRMVRAAAAAVPDGSPHVVWSNNQLLADALERMDYSASRRLSVMTIELPAQDRMELPVGIELREFGPGIDEQAWLETNNAAFAGHPENGGVTAADLAVRMKSSWFRPEDLLMAWDGDQLAGSCWTKRHGDGVGEIYIIGVHPAYQHRGLGRSLVLAGLDHLATVAGATKGMLYVDRAQAGAYHLYVALGFQEERTIAMFVPPGTGAATHPNG
jgi:mycothiol synthase